MTPKNLKVGIVAGELSGDILGAGLINALKRHVPNLTVQGIGGPRMVAAGCESWYPLELLSVMGLVEVLGRLPSLFRCRADLVKRFKADPPDVFIGIDAPDFTLGLERQLRDAGIPTVHYVSPTVWAWRESRIKKIVGSCDLMLTLLPFEAEFYEAHNLPVQFVGHPLAEQISLENDQQQARRRLGLNEIGEWLALLPGSRRTEVSKLSEPFLRTAQWLATHRPDLNVVVPMANDVVRQVFAEQLATIDGPMPTVTLIEGQSQTAMTAADIVLTASGTATLEAMLLKRPMVMAYKVAPLTYTIAKQLVRIERFALPNLLAEKELIPEFIQHDVVPENMGKPLLHWLENPNVAEQLKQDFGQLHGKLRQNANDVAAQAVLKLLNFR